MVNMVYYALAVIPGGVSLFSNYFPKELVDYLETCLLAAFSLVI